MSSNSDLVREAMTALFINGDVSALDRYWAPDCGRPMFEPR